MGPPMRDRRPDILLCRLYNDPSVALAIRDECLQYFFLTNGE